MNQSSYIVIQAFMVDDLKLKGNELIVYAVIHGFTHDGNHWYYGTRGHLAEWCGATKGTVSNCLKSLMDKGYITRRVIDKDGFMQVQYKANFCNGVSKIDRGANKNCDTPLLKFDSNNIIDRYTNDKGSENSKGEIRECPKCGAKSERHGSIFACTECNTAWSYND